jgi:short-subunit dehydrogenase
VASELSGVSDLDINKKRFWISSEEAAKKILSAVEKGKYHIAFPWYFRFFMSIMRILPHFSYRLFWRLAKRGG